MVFGSVVGYGVVTYVVVGVLGALPKKYGVVVPMLVGT